MTVLFLHAKSQRVIFFTQQDVTFLQSIEGTQLNPVTFYGQLPQALTRANSLNWSFDGSTFSQLQNAPSDEVRLLHRKASLLAKIQAFVVQVRRPYAKMLLDQQYVYDRKYDEAVQYINATDRVSILPSLSYFADEVEIMKKDPLTTALEIRRVRLEREAIYRCSERARRALNEKVCFARSLEECNIVDQLINERNFKLPMSV